VRAQTLWLAVVAALVGYLVGSISPAALIARARGIDLRTLGSGNPGATNAGRVMGRGVGVVVGLLDVLKGLVPTLVFGWIGGVGVAMVAGLFAVLGHCTSPWLKGRGGKGVATSFGAILGVSPLWGLWALAAFLVVFGLTRWVAAASVAAALALVVAAGAAWFVDPQTLSAWRFGWALALAGIVLFRHRRNLWTRISGRIHTI